jgi:hypothetical protein
MLPDGQLAYQDDSARLTDAVLYKEEPEKEQIGLARAVFRAIGFLRKKIAPVKATKSRDMAKSKQRKPLFGPEDEKDE